jgi:hypothetical protein
MIHPVSGDSGRSIPSTLTWNSALKAWTLWSKGSRTGLNTIAAWEGCLRKFLAVRPSGKSVFLIQCADKVLTRSESDPTGWNFSPVSQHSFTPDIEQVWELSELPKND